MYVEIEPADSDGSPCHECLGSFRKGEPTLHLTVKDPWTKDGRGAITVYCFSCFMEFVDGVDEVRREFSTASTEFDARQEALT